MIFRCLIKKQDSLKLSIKTPEDDLPDEQRIDFTEQELKDYIGIGADFVIARAMKFSQTTTKVRKGQTIFKVFIKPLDKIN